MPHHHNREIELLASILEIAGTFLLSVEAIKLEKLKALKSGLFAKVVHVLTPKIIVEKNATGDVIRTMEQRVLNRVYVILTFIGAAFLLALIQATGGSLIGIWKGFEAAGIGPQWLRVIFAGLLTVSSLGLSAFVGFALYSITLIPFKASLKTLEWIENNTANGVIGILGFLLCLVGVLIHAYFSWIEP
jgi:hypothetical protein